MRQHICVLFADHLWISNNVKVEDCGIFLIHTDNHFNGVVKRNGFSLLMDFEKVKGEILSTSYVSVTVSEAADESSTIKDEKNVDCENAQVDSKEEPSTERNAEVDSIPALPSVVTKATEEVSQEKEDLKTDSNDFSFEVLKALDEESLEHRYDEDLLPKTPQSMAEKWRHVPMQIATPLFMMDGDTNDMTNINTYLNMLGREMFEVPASNDHLFNSIRPQIMPQRSTKYTGRHMRYHVMQFFEEHKEDLSAKLIPMLKYRPSINLEKWQKMMLERSTCGYELTLVVLDKLFNTPILVLREDYIWTSREIVPFKCPIVVVLTRDGNFKGTKGHRVRVGQVPKVVIPRVVQVLGKPKVVWPKRKDLEIKEAAVSTPKVPSGIDVGHPVFPEMINEISPITDMVQAQKTQGEPLQDSTNKNNAGSASVSSSFDTYSEPVHHSPPPAPISAKKIVPKDTTKKVQSKLHGESQKPCNVNEQSATDGTVRTKDDSKFLIEPNSDDGSDNRFNLNLFEPNSDEDQKSTKNDDEQKDNEKRNTQDKDGMDKDVELRKLNITLENLDISSTVTIQKEETKEYSVVKFRCRKCGDVSVTKEGYRAHLFQAHDIRRVSLNLPEEVTCVTISPVEPSSAKDSNTKEYVLYTCSLCHEKFNIRHELREHFTEEHGLFKKCPKFGVPCGLCCKRFYFEIGMGEHLKTEHGIVGGVKSMEKLVKQNIPYAERKKPPTVDVINSAIGTEFPKETREKYTKAAQLSEKIKDRIMSQSSIRVTRAQKQKRLEEEFEMDKKKKDSEDDVSDTDIKPKVGSNKSEVDDLTQADSQVDSPKTDANNQSTKNSTPNHGRGRKAKPKKSPKKKFQSKKPSAKFGKQTPKKYSLRSNKTVKAEPISDDDSQDEDWVEPTSDADSPPKKDSVNPRKRSSNAADSGDAPSKKPKKQLDDDDFNYPCDNCDETFENYDQLQQHRQKCSKYPKKHICPKCKKGFQQKSLLDQHYRRRHTNLPPLYVCKECNTIFEFEKCMKRHNKKYHDPNGQKFVCETCGKSFVTKWEFKQHRNGVHLNIKEFYVDVAKIKPSPLHPDCSNI